MDKGASKDAVSQYNSMQEDMASMKAVGWSSEGFSLDPYDLVFLPGGHEKCVVQVINSPIVHRLMADYFPQTLKPSKKSCAAICHGVMVLSESSSPDGKSVIHGAHTTALPGAMEQSIFWGTRLALGDYYKTYGAGSESVETSVYVLVAVIGNLLTSVQGHETAGPQEALSQQPRLQAVSDHVCRACTVLN